MAWTKMGEVPNPIFDTNGDPYAGAVLKVYLAGTTTTTPVGINKNGTSTQATLTANANGVWEVSGNEVSPFIDRECKWGIFANATDAAANTPFYMGPFDFTPQSVSGQDSQKVFETVADMVASTTLNIGDYVRTLGYTTIGDGGDNEYDIVAAATGTADGGSYIDLATHQAKGLFPGSRVNIVQFGAIDGSGFSTTALQNSIIYLRSNPVTILDTIGGNNITAYSSGIINFTPGTYKIAPDAIKIYQDVGLTLRGAGSRRTNNAVKAGTTLLISGTSSGFGIQAYRSGGRGLTIEDMDIVYEDSNFTGDVLDIIDSPGVTLNRVFLGTDGITGATRIQSAQSCIRSTYDEFLTCNNCVFDGATRGWYSDDTRTELGNTFGGSFTTFNECVFYDFSENHVYHAGNRTRQNVVFKACAFNPISVSPSSSAINMDNVEGISLISTGFVPSTTFAPSSQWLRLTNATGIIHGCVFDDLAVAGLLDGMLDIRGNRIFCTDGFTLRGGVITGSANEFSKGLSGYTVSPTYDLTLDLGPDLFKAAVTNSYNISADSVFLSGRINYSSNNDASTSKFTNASGRISIENIDKKQFTVADASYIVSITDTGRTVSAIGGTTQTFTLPDSVPGTVLTITKLSSQVLNINCDAGDNFYTGSGAVTTSAQALAADVGGSLVLEAYATVGWIVKSRVGTWTFT